MKLLNLRMEKSKKLIARAKQWFVAAHNTVLEKTRAIVSFLRNHIWEALIICVSIGIAAFSFYQLVLNSETIDEPGLLSNILTVNGVFSAILITYLFSRITWINDRKLELYNECITLSQKITEFRRILKRLTDYYNVWSNNDKNTKSLIDFGRFEHLDFYDVKLKFISNCKSQDDKLINELCEHPDFVEGKTMTYLAMVSMVCNRKADYAWQEELYKDHEKKGIYNYSVVKRWKHCNIADTIAYWMNYDPDWINYDALRKEHGEIVASAARINAKYKKSAVNNKLIEELAQDMQHHYITELYRNQRQLREGVEGLNLVLLILITFSLVFGVLIPLVLIFMTQGKWYNHAVHVTTALNVGFISFFILKFPFFIRRELSKWT